MADTTSDLQTRGNGGSISNDVLTEINTIDDALEVLRNAGVLVRRASDEMGDGFILLDDKGKRTLVGTPFLILAATESEGDFGKSMVTLRLVTADHRKYIVNDGSTGIRDQVVSYLNNHDTIAGLMVEKGLRQSDYRYCGNCKTISRKNASRCGSCGNADSATFTPGTTYYLDVSA